MAAPPAPVLLQQINHWENELQPPQLQNHLASFLNRALLAVMPNLDAALGINGPTIPNAPIFRQARAVTTAFGSHPLLDTDASTRRRAFLVFAMSHNASATHFIINEGSILSADIGALEAAGTVTPGHWAVDTTTQVPSLSEARIVGKKYLHEAKRRVVEKIHEVVKIIVDNTGGQAVWQASSVEERHAVFWYYISRHPVEMMRLLFGIVTGANQIDFHAIYDPVHAGQLQSVFQSWFKLRATEAARQVTSTTTSH